MDKATLMFTYLTSILLKALV